ncbi:MAG TPA: ribonuclease HI, partial [Thiomicrospira sp.]|nr:ribonuclease HI [Thiomicrospira sp.]
MAKKFYVVWQGREPGIYTDWNSCKKQVDKFAGAKYKSFSSLAEAEQAFVGSHGASTAK